LVLRKLQGEKDQTVNKDKGVRVQKEKLPNPHIVKKTRDKLRGTNGKNIIKYKVQQPF